MIDVRWFVRIKGPPGDPYPLHLHQWLHVETFDEMRARNAGSGEFHHYYLVFGCTDLWPPKSGRPPLATPFKTKREAMTYRDIVGRGARVVRITRGRP